MKLRHNFIQGRTGEILPCVDRNFPRHSAVWVERQEGKREPIYCKMLHSQQEGINHAKAYGFGNDIPVGF